MSNEEFVLTAEQKVRIKDVLVGLRNAAAYTRDPLRSDAVAREEMMTALLMLFGVAFDTGLLDAIIKELSDNINGVP